MPFSIAIAFECNREERKDLRTFSSLCLCLQRELTLVFCLQKKMLPHYVVTCQRDSLIGPVHPTFSLSLLLAGNAINLANEGAKYSNLWVFLFWQAHVSKMCRPVSPSPLVSGDDTRVISIPPSLPQRLKRNISQNASTGRNVWRNTWSDLPERCSFVEKGMLGKDWVTGTPIVPLFIGWHY